MDFPQALKDARTRAMLRQSELARRCGLTSSYISLLESGKKPPPSEKVVRNLAAALGLNPEPLIELANIGKAPESMKKKVESLEEGLKKQKRLNSKMMNHLVPMSLFTMAGHEGSFETAFEGIFRGLGRSSAALKKAFLKLRGQGSFEEFREDSRELIEKLGDEEKESLVEKIAGVPPGRVDSPPAGQFSLPVYASVPVPPAASAEVPALRTEQVPGTWFTEGRYFYAAQDDTMFPRIEKGDLLLADEGISPRTGDIALALVSGASMVAKFMDTGDSIELSPVNPLVPPRRFAKGDSAREGVRICATVLRVVRNLR